MSYTDAIFPWVLKSWCHNLRWQLFLCAWRLSHAGVWFSAGAKNAMHASRCTGKSKMALVPPIHASLTWLNITPAAYQVGHLAAVLAGRSQRTCPSPANSRPRPLWSPRRKICALHMSSKWFQRLWFMMRPWYHVQKVAEADITQMSYFASSKHQSFKTSNLFKIISFYPY